jgi:antitoxin PrlF
MPSRVAKDGRVTVPKMVRDYLGLIPGAEAIFRRASDGSIVIERADGTRPPSRFAKVIGARARSLHGRVYETTSS